MAITTHLIKGETFTLKNKGESDYAELADNEINDKYKKGEIRIVTEQARYPLDSILNMLDSKQGDKSKYILNPEYQRRKHWSNARKSRLIESFIMNVPIPPIFLYEVDYAIFEVMDGQQRLTTIYDYYTGKFQLEGLEYWPELNGKQYQDLPAQVRKGIDRRYLSSIVLLQETAKSKEGAESLKQIVFERLNSGGEKLTPQETRNALHDGKFNKLCIKLAKNDTFRKMWHLPLESDGEEKLLESEFYLKMEDVEMVLRFFAYRHVDKLTSPLDKFLDNFLKQANQYSNETLANLENLFLQTIDTIYEVLGDEAFLLPTKELVQKSPTKTIYDPLMQAFAKNIKHKEIFIKNKELIKANLYEDKLLLNRNEKSKNAYLFDGRYNNRKEVQVRIDYFHNFLQKNLS